MRLCIIAHARLDVAYLRRVQPEAVTPLAIVDPNPDTDIADAGQHERSGGT